MVWLPDWKWKQQQGGGGGGNATATLLKALLGAGGGGGGGKSGWKNPSADMISRVAKKNPEKTVWIGGLGKAIGKEGNKKLKAHIESLVGTGPKFVNITQGPRWCDLWLRSRGPGGHRLSK